MNLDYFKDQNLKELFESLKEKYIKTSKLSGTIKIIAKSDASSTKISRFLGQNVKTNEITTIKIKNIEKSLITTKFYNASLLEILNYLYPNLKTNKEKREDHHTMKNNLLEELKTFYSQTRNKKWLDENLNDPEFFNKTMNLLTHEKDLLYNIVSSLDKIYDIETWENLSIFATKITGNPHYFDLENKNASNLTWYLSKLLNLEYENTRNKKIEILNKVNIYTDSYSNFVITYNFLGETYLDDLSKRNEVAILNLDNILKLEKIYAQNKKVVILENPSLLANIINLKTNSAFIISSGNPNISVYKLMDKLENHQFYYNGDFDPEGILIADKFKKQYLHQLTLFCYSKELFQKSKSNTILNSSRIKKLDKARSLELEVVKNEIKNSNLAGYQEKIIEDINKFIRELEK